MLKEFVFSSPWMLPIVVVSVIGLMFILERAWFWVQLWMRQDARLRRRLLHGEPPGPGARTRDPHAEVLLDLANYPEDPKLALERAKMLIRDSKANLKVLAIAAGVGSALGLFGTVVGMSTSFRGVGLGNPEKIMAGMHTALNTTILGLVVYIVCYVAHGFFAQKSVNLSQDLEEDLNQTRRAIESRAAGIAA